MPGMGRMMEKSTRVLDQQLLLFSLPVMPDSLRPHGLQLARPPCSSGSCFVRTLHYDPSILGDPTRHGLLTSLRVTFLILENRDKEFH